MRKLPTLAILILLGGTAYAVAQTTHGDNAAAMDHADHSQSGVSDSMLLTEPGQGAFAVMSEIVKVLEADPETDWSTVDMNGLRDHLLDMDRLVTHTVVDEVTISNGLRATTSGDIQTIATLQRMIPAHAAELAKDPRWSVDVLTLEDSVVLTVTSDDPNVVARINGLGFFGLMASQDHHKEHHLTMARGEDVHSH